MYDDTLAFAFLGTEIYAYGLMVMLGVWAGLVLFYALCGKCPALKDAAVLTGLMALPLALMLARLLYCLGDPAFHPLLSLKNVLNLRTGGFAMYGALTGAVLTALMAARLGKISAAPLLDRLAPALAAFLIPARLGEGFTMLGLSRPLTIEAVAGSFLARQESYGSFLRTYLIEALVAMILLWVLMTKLRRPHKAGQVFTLGCLLYGISQTLMESLRFDGHLRYSFVGLQQVLSAVLFGVTLIVLAARAIRRGGKKTLPFITLALLPVIVGAAIALEFMIDRSSAGKIAAYGLYILLLAIPAQLGILLLRQEAAHDQRAD
jgi:phosphatidylglycerol:prolipoprotein diacylglycerol transferase